MSGTLNKVMLIGHLGDDVKIKHFDNGGCIARFPMATNETYTNKSTNEKVTNTDWHNIVLRNKAAEICEKYLSKGDKVYVEYEYHSEGGGYGFFMTISELVGFTCCLGLLLSIVFLIIGFSQGKPGMGWGGVSALLSFPVVAIMALIFMW